jgi:hypothetical protein
VDAARKSQYPTLADLASAPTPALRQLYVEVLGSPAPRRARAALLRSNIAWAVQAHSSGKKPTELRTALLKALNRQDRTKREICKPGTRLIREWQGEVHEVTVLESGYRWRGHTYRSLSAIAEMITGAHWSGPRFFGTTKAKR